MRDWIVFLKRRLRALACFGMLEIAALFGMPMRAEQIQELAQLVNDSKAQDTLPSEEDSGDPPPDYTASKTARGGVPSTRAK
jgi:hypothetical protein